MLIIRYTRIVLLCLISLLGPQILSAQVSLDTWTSPANFLVEQTLTGYGHIKVWQDNTLLEHAKLWLIACENQDKASLLQAKFLSDIQINPVNGQLIKQQSMQCFQTASGTGVGAIRLSQWVVLFTLTDVKQLGNLAQAVARQAHCQSDDLHWDSTVTVPMYMDRFDKHGFRFYYRPWEVPDASQAKTYNPISEFDFAKAKGDVGFVFWEELNQVTTGEGQFSDGWWAWALQAATDRNLPVQINANVSYETPVWMTNRNVDWITRKMPGYVGAVHHVASPFRGGMGIPVMGDNPLRREALGNIQHALGHFNQLPNVTSWLEPYGEVQHGKHDIFLDFGPEVDKGYRDWLKNQYQTLSQLSQRWHGNTHALKSWDDVTYPQLVHFLGFDDSAMDLTGTWKINFAPDGKTCPMDWYTRSFDDSTWGTLTVPGDDHMMFLPRKPAVYRREIKLPSDRQLGQRTWLYLWDLTDRQKLEIAIYLNDKPVSVTQSINAFPHWTVVEVTDQLRDGSNCLAVGLPRGFLAYRTYLTHHEPVGYPYLGRTLNNQWVDFADFSAYQRAKTVQDGMQMIRQIDTTRSITMMAPDYVADLLKEQAAAYNGNFHNTGYMSGFWADYLPMLMRSADRPFTLEPGGPAKTADEFEKMLGLWLTEGVNAVDYFIHIGAVMWDNAIRLRFEKYLPVIHAIGSFHQPKAQIAQLVSPRVERLTGFPWQPDSDVNLPPGYWRWSLSRVMSGDYAMDTITDLDFANSVADDYKLVIDLNTTILSEKTLTQIEAWVRKGGTFITFMQTGRHLPDTPDAWPISKLTGYDVLTCDAISQVEAGKIRRKVILAKDVKDYVLPPELMSANGHGQRLKANDPDCEDMLLWDDGSVAMGRRKLGRGYVVHMGVSFSRDYLWSGKQNATLALIRSMLEYFQMPTLPGQAKGVRFRHAISNNGLYDVWLMWNESRSAVTTNLDVYDSSPKSAFDLLTGQSHVMNMEKQNSRLANVTLEPNEVRVYLTQRQNQRDAPAQWLNLQRRWWKQSTGALGEPYVKPTYPNTLSLAEGWLPQATGTIWPDRLHVKPNHAVSESQQQEQIYTRSFTVPSEWDGQIIFWMQSWLSLTFVGQGRVELDGHVLADWSNRGIEGKDLTSQLKPGSTHTLTVRLRSEEALIGMRGECWLHHLPKPDATLDLAGQWQMSDDVLNFDRTITLPGSWQGYMARRKIVIPQQYSSKQAFLSLTNNGMVLGAIINGHWIRSHHHAVGQRFDLNLTPWVRFGQENDLTLVYWNSANQCDVQDVHFYFQD